MKVNVIRMAVVGLLVQWGVSLYSHEITPQKTKQLKALFPNASGFSEEHVKLNDAQVKAVENVLRGKVGPMHKELAVFKAEADAKILGFAAFFETKEPDGDMAPAAVGVEPSGAIAKVAVFTHHADENPLAQDAFLGQFTGKTPADSEAWHPGHTLQLVHGKEQDSLDMAKSIRRMSAVILEAAKGMRGGKSAKTSSSGSSQKPEAGHAPELGSQHDDGKHAPHTHSH